MLFFKFHLLIIFDTKSRIKTLAAKQKQTNKKIQMKIKFSIRKKKRYKIISLFIKKLKPKSNKEKLYVYCN